MNKKISFIKAILILLCLAHVLVLAQVRIYPFVDTPFHLAASTIVRHYNSVENRFSEFYSLDMFPKPNVFHTLFCAAPIFPSVEFGNRAFYCLYAILLFWSVWLIGKRIGGNQWFTLLVPLALINYPTQWGFVGFTFGIPIVLLIFYLQMDSNWYLERKNLILLTGLFLLLFFVHMLSLLFALLLWLVMTLWHSRKQWRESIRKVPVVLPVMLLIVVWISMESGFKSESVYETYGAEETREMGLFGFLFQYYVRVFFSTIPGRLKYLSYDNAHLFPGPRGILVGFMLLIFLAWPTMRWLFSGERLSKIKPGTDIANPMIFLLTAAGCYLLLPNRLPGEPVLYERFLVYITLGFIFTAAAFTSRELSKGWKISIVAVALFHLFATGVYFRDFEKDSADFTPELIAGDPMTEKFGAMIYDYTTKRGEITYVRFPEYYIVWHQGIACTNLVDFRFGVVGRKVSPDVLPPYNEWVGARDNPDLRYPKSGVELVLTRGNLSQAAQYCLEDYTKIRTSGKWALYRLKEPAE